MPTAQKVAVEIKSYYRTDIGIIRSNNEDIGYASSKHGIFVVIDGMGGQAAGEVAAREAWRIIVERLQRSDGTVENRIREAIVLANNAIYDKAQEKDDYQGMACVLTVAVVEGNELFYGHVGDTRLYLLRPDGKDEERIVKLTSDHSPVGEREDSGELSEEQAMHHVRRNEVFRDVGSQWHDPHDLYDDNFIEFRHHPFESNWALLLCSDGLTDLVKKKKILDLVEQYADKPEDVTLHLINAANDAGGKDNVTVVFAAGNDYARALRGEFPVETAIVHPINRDEIPTSRRPEFVPAQPRPATTAVSARHVSPQQRNLPAQLPQNYSLSPYGHDWAMVNGRQPSPEQNLSPQRLLLPGEASETWTPISKKLLKWSGILLAGGAFAAVCVYLLHLIAQNSSSNLPPVPSSDGTGVSEVTLRVGTAQEFKTIRAALENAPKGCRILIDSGTYEEPISLRDKEEIALIGKDAVLKLPAKYTGERNMIILDGVKNVKISGFVIRGESGAPIDVGVWVRDSTIELSNLSIHGTNKFGLRIFSEFGKSRVNLKESRIIDVKGQGVSVEGMSAVKIEDTEFILNGRRCFHIGTTKLEDGESLSCDPKYAVSSAAQSSNAATSKQ